MTNNKLEKKIKDAKNKISLIEDQIESYYKKIEIFKNDRKKTIIAQEMADYFYSKKIANVTIEDLENGVCNKSVIKRYEEMYSNENKQKLSSSYDKILDIIDANIRYAYKKISELTQEKCYLNRRIFIWEITIREEIIEF